MKTYPHEFLGRCSTCLDNAYLSSKPCQIGFGLGQPVHVDDCLVRQCQQAFDVSKCPMTEDEIAALCGGRKAAKRLKQHPDEFAAKLGEAMKARQEPQDADAETMAEMRSQLWAAGLDHEESAFVARMLFRNGQRITPAKL